MAQRRGDRDQRIGGTLALIVSLLHGAAALAQQAPPPPSISGVVHAADGKTPIANAIVMLTNTTFAALTDDKGVYAIEDVPPGNYELRVSLAGYDDAIMQVVVAPNQPLQLTNTLQKTVTGEEIVVTGSKFPEKRVEAPVTIERVTSQDIEQTGASNYMTALSQVKGLQYRQSGVGDTRISMRGFDSQFNTRMLFMEDGRLTEFPGTGVPMGASLPTPSLDIKSVEVVVGPASALYGANAVDGVVNVITKTPWDESGATASLRVGNQNIGDVSLRLAGTIKRRFGYKVNFQWVQADDFVPDRNLPFHYYGAIPKAPTIFEGDLVANHYKNRQAKVEGFVYGRLGHDWNLKAGGGWSTTDGMSATNTGRNELRGYQIDFETVQLSHPNWFAQVTRTGSNAGNTYQADALGTYVQLGGGLAKFDSASLEALRLMHKFIDNSQMIDSELQYRTELWKALRVTVGGQFRAYFPNSNGTYLDDAKTPIRRYVGGEYLQAEWEALHRRIRLVAAVRVDEFSDYGVQASPKGAVVISLAKDHFLRVGYNRAFRTPTILDAYLNIPTFAAYGNHTGFVIKDMSGNVTATIPALQPEQNNTLELGYKGSIKRRVFVDLVGFYSFYDNFISPLTPLANPAKGSFAFLADGKTPTFAGSMVQGALLTYTNFGKAQVAGANAGFDAWLWRDKLVLTGSVSYIHLVDFTVSNAMQKQLPLNVPEWTSRFSLQMQDVGFRGLFFRFQGRVQEHYKFQSGFWDSTRPDFAKVLPNGELPNRFVADLVAGVRFNNGVSVSGTIYNLFNDHGIDVLGAPPSAIVGFVQLQYTYSGLDY